MFFIISDNFFSNITPRTNYFTDDLNSSILVHLAIQLTDFSPLCNFQNWDSLFLSLLYTSVLYSPSLKISEIINKKLINLHNLSSRKYIVFRKWDIFVHINQEIRKEFVGHRNFSEKGKVWRVIGEWWKKRITSGKGNKGKQNRVQQGLFVIKSGRQWHRDISVRVNSFAVNNTRSLDESSDFSTSLRYRNAESGLKCGPSSFRKPEGGYTSIDVTPEIFASTAK